MQLQLKQAMMRRSLKQQHLQMLMSIGRLSTIASFFTVQYYLLWCGDEL